MTAGKLGSGMPAHTTHPGLCDHGILQADVDDVARAQRCQAPEDRRTLRSRIDMTFGYGTTGVPGGREYLYQAASSVSGELSRGDLDSKGPLVMGRGAARGESGQILTVIIRSFWCRDDPVVIGVGRRGLRPIAPPCMSCT